MKIIDAGGSGTTVVLGPKIMDEEKYGMEYDLWLEKYV